MRWAAIMAGVVAAATIPTAAHADSTSDTVSTSILAGALTATVSVPTRMTAVTLDGRDTQTSIGTTEEWTITNARGSSAGWSLSVSATDFVSAAGTRDTVARTITADHLTITPGIVNANIGQGADTPPSTLPIVLAGQPQSLVWTSTGGKGTFTLTPVFALTVPANSYRSNFSGERDISAVNPYVSHLTFTIA